MRDLMTTTFSQWWHRGVPPCGDRRSHARSPLEVADGLPNRQSAAARWLNLYVLAALCVLLWTAFALLDVDVLNWLARFDTDHEGWYIDETVVVTVLWFVGWVAVEAIKLRHEVERRRQAELTASSLARHDPLTGLPNRRVLLESVAEAAMSASAEHPAALLLIDLDRFKPVNDLHGHAVGDALLCEVAGRLTALTEHCGLAARLGGDEFAVLLPQATDTSDISRTAGRIIARLSEPTYIDSKRVEIGASIGIALTPIDGIDASQLLRAADVALYRSKAEGRGICRFFEDSMDAIVREEAAIKAELREAIATGQIIPFYQPTVDLETGEVNGFEVLARWRHPSRGLLLPEKFIAAAEDIGLITRMTISLFEQVCSDMHKWPDDYRFSINISPSQLYDATLFDRLREVMGRSGIQPCRFEMEITEGALIDDIERARAVVQSLRDIGFTVALDDFGTGYASLYHLREIQFDRVKIDKTFVLDIDKDARAATYVEAMVRLGSSLHLSVTAEGIEDHAALEMLRHFGCAVGQGFWFSEPLPAADIAAAVARLEYAGGRAVV